MHSNERFHSTLIQNQQQSEESVDRTRNVEDEVSITSSQYSEVDDGTLYELCISASLSESSENEIWDDIRVWLHNASDEERAAGVSPQEHNHKNALHEVCNHPNPPIDIVANLLESSPNFEIAKAIDKTSWVPLHIACNTGVSAEVIQLLVDAYPDGTTLQDEHGRTPLHFLVSRELHPCDQKSLLPTSTFLPRQESSVVQTMAQAASILTSVQRPFDSTSADQIPDSMNDMLPIHYACAYGMPTAVVQVLIDAYPQSISKTDKYGRTPLHYSMRNGDNSESPHHIQLLIANDPANFDPLQNPARVVDMEDINGTLSLHLLGKRANELDVQLHTQREYVTESLLIYLGSKPLPTTNFITTLQKLPHWLKDTAVMNTYVKSIVNQKISKRIPTMFLLLDGTLSFSIFIIFAWFGLKDDSLDVDSCTLFRLNNTITNDVYVYWDPQSMSLFFYIVAGYFLVHELLQMFSLYSLGNFRSWSTNSGNWIDLLLITLLFRAARLMELTFQSNHNIQFQSQSQCPISKEQIKITYVLLILSMAMKIFFVLKSFREKFAVFVNGVMYVVHQLFIFGFALFCVLLAFSEIFYILFYKSETCEQDPNFAHCDQFRSLLRVYSNLMGEVYPQNYTEKPEYTFFFMMYVLVAIILLSNVLIAVVTDNYKVIKNTRASMVFWSNRLDSAAEMDAISRVVTLFSPFRSVNIHNTTSTIITSEEQQWDYIVWNNLMSLFYEHYEMGTTQIMNGEFCIIWSYRLLAMVILPLWCIIGFCTAGLLWPPQIRQILIPNVCLDAKVDASFVIANQISELRREVHRNYQELKSELRQDRRELQTMKTESEALQSDVLADMMQVKEILSTLLELRRDELNL